MRNQGYSQQVITPVEGRVDYWNADGNYGLHDLDAVYSTGSRWGDFNNAMEVKNDELYEWADKNKDLGFIDFADKEVAPVSEKAGSASKKVGLASAAVGAEPVAAFFYPLSNALEGVAGGIHIVKELKDKEYGSAIVRAVFSTYGNKVDDAIVRDKVLDEARKVGYRYVLGETIDATQEKVIDECKQ